MNVGTPGQQVRRLNVHEYVSMKIMADHNIDIPASKMAETPEAAEEACKEIMGGDGEATHVRMCSRAFIFCFFLRRLMAFSSRGYVTGYVLRRCIRARGNVMCMYVPIHIRL